MNRKRNSGRAISIVVFITILLVAIGLGSLVMISGTLNKIERVSAAPVQYVAPEEEFFEETTSEPDTLAAEKVSFNTDNISLMRSDDVKNLLLIGQDARTGEDRQRSDSMIICSISTQSNKIVLTSLMRDMYVPIPGYSDNRINAAYMFGGMALLDDVIEEDFGIHIDGNVEVDFDGFLKAFAVIGDLEIELKKEEADYLNQHGIWLDQGTDNLGWDLKPGKNTMTPEQVLAYARIRHVGNSDWERTERQRNVLTKAFQKAQKSDMATLIKLANQLFPCLTTDLTISEILTYVKTVYTNGINTLESYRLPVEGSYSSETIRSMSVLVPDLYMNSVYLQHYVYGTELDEAAKKLEAEFANKHITRDEEPAETYTEPVQAADYEYIAPNDASYVYDPGYDPNYDPNYEPYIDPAYYNPSSGTEEPAVPEEPVQPDVPSDGEIPVDTGGGDGGEVPVDTGGGDGGGEVIVDTGGGEVPVDTGGGEVVSAEE